MHGCTSTSVLLVNAEFDSMGGVVEGGVGIVNKTSPRRAAIEKVQAELRQEYEIREKRNRELAFLEEGGDPMEYYKIRSAASVSVHSTSFTDQLVTSEAKGSIAFTASPHGDSVESSGRLGEKPFESNGADNLVLFDAEHEFSEGDKNSLHASRSNIVPSEKLSQVGGIQRTREHGDSAAFGLPRKAYKRRYRSRPNRDGTRSSSTDVNPTRAIQSSSIPSRHGLRDVKGLISDAENLNASIDCISKATSPVDGAVQKTGLTDSQQDMELDGIKTVESTKDQIDGVPVDATSDVIASEIPLHDQQSHPGVVKTPIRIDSDGTESVQAVEEFTSAVVECQRSANAIEVENHSSSCQMNGFSNKKEDGMEDGIRKTSASRGINSLASDKSCTQTSLCVDGNNDSELYSKVRNADSKGKIYDQTLVPDVDAVVKGDESVKDKKQTEALGSSTLVNVMSPSAGLNRRDNGFKLHPEDELNQSGATLKNDGNDQFVIEETEASGRDGSESGRKPADIRRLNNLNSSNVRQQGSVGISISDLPESGSLTRLSTVSLEAQTSSLADLNLARKIDEDSILKEAQIIEAKRKRIAELSFATSPKQIHPKSHWNYVLEEMAWLANDFAQERIWKIAAAAQTSSRAAFTCQLRKKEKSSGMKAKKVAHTLAKSVMEFWDSVEETSNVQEQQHILSVQAYAVRFLKYNKSNIVHNLADWRFSPDRVSDMEILDLSWGDNIKEENLFYTIPPGAMQTYKNSIESHVAKFERIASRVQEDVETSACGASAGFESEDNTYDEVVGETNTYDMSMAFEGSKSSRAAEKNRKQLINAYGVRSYEVSSDILQMQSAENKVATQTLLGKRPGASLNVSIPTKRVRTASRRVISPFSAGTSACIQVPNKTDVSSGDTNSFQDDQSTLRGGSLVPHSLEVESVGAFEKQLPFESAEVSTKHKKKKKAKHLNAAYEPRWQVDSTFQNEQFQRDHLKKSHQLESNGSSGLLGQPMMKKPKIMRQSQDNTFENITPITGSVPSPVVSQMSNMSNPNKFIKMLGGRDRGRKPKGLKMPAGQPGSGNPWTLYEDQALVVLAHDLGPNWGLVTDAFNYTLKLMCIYRNAKECKERHIILMDKTSGDGADSAEDLGPAQPYSSTLRGIPNGAARQLFKRLQVPMEEDTLKSHFEKIISIGQKQYCRKNQNDYQDPKHLEQLHVSHTNALSQLCPNNLNGGHVLTPLDLCDATMAAHDVLSPGYQGQHSGGLAIPNHGIVTPMHPASGSCSVLQGSSNMMLGNNFSSSPGSLNSSVRDGRYGVPRSASLSPNEQQRMQQYSQMIPGRNMPQPNVSAPGALTATERGARIIPSGNSMGLGSGVNRSMPIARPGFQGISSPSLVNSGSMVSPVMSPGNMHSGVGGSGQGAMLRPRDALHMTRPGLSQDSQKQMMVSDPVNNQSHFGGSSSPFPNASSPVTSHPLHHQQSHPVSPQQPQVPNPHHPHFQGPANHAPNAQQQAYAIRLAKERQQHRLMQQQQQQQQQQYGASSSLMPHIQSQPQIPSSSPVQSGSQLQPQAGSSPASLSPLASSMNSTPQNQQKPQAPTRGVVRNAQQPGGSGLANQAGKQRQKQVSQANRQHPQQRQQPQGGQQPIKVAKGVGRGNTAMHQKIPIDPSLVNGVSTNPGNQFSQKGEAATHSTQSQGLYTGSALNAVQPTRQHISSQSNQSMPQQKINSASSIKHPHQMTHSDNSSQASGHQSVSSSAVAGSNHQHALSHQKLTNRKHLLLQRVVPSNHQINSDPSNKPQVRDSDSDQHLTTSSTEVDPMAALPQATSNTTTAVQPISPASAPQWHASEPFFDPNTLNPAANVSMPNSSESSPQGAQGRGQRLPSASVPSIRHDVSAQWQKQPSQLQNPNSPVPQQQQQQPPPLHSQAQPQPQPLHSQQKQQQQLLQAGSGNLYSRPTDHRLE
ncbi:hypothetical protein ABFS83_14G054400 [Erythranthe nasuta]